jgi:hypothetical protein
METLGRKSAVAVLLGCALAGCASTSLTSYRDPAFADARFGKVAVLASGVQLDDRIALENRMVGALRNKRIAAEAVIRLFPPTRQISDEDLRTALLAEGYDAILYIQRVESGSKIQPSWTQMFGGSSANNMAERLYASFDASLVDLETLKVAWMASARTGGSEYADGTEIVASFAEGTADALESKQLLANRSPRQR